MKIRKTPLFYLVLLLCVVGIPYGIYGLTLPGWEAALGFVVLAVVVASVVLFTLEQLLVKSLKANVLAVLLIDVGMLSGAIALAISLLG